MNDEEYKQKAKQFLEKQLIDFKKKIKKTEEKTESNQGNLC